MDVLTSNPGTGPIWQTITPGVVTIDGDSGSATGDPITFNATTNSGSTVNFAASGATVDLHVSDVPNANTIIGGGAGNGAISGQGNVGLGTDVLLNLTSGNNNMMFGHAAGNQIFTGSQNVGVGYLCLITCGSGDYNIGIGYTAGFNYTGAESNNILFNNNGVLGESNTLHIGAGTGTGVKQLKAAYISGINGVNVGSVASVVSISGDQLGSTAITAGSGITVTPGANTITIAGTTSATWSKITVNQTAVVNNGYITDKAGTLALLLPATAAIGDIIKITGINTATGWQITQNANQQIFVGATSTTLGVAGTVTSTAVRDSIELVCVVAGASTAWNAINWVGNLTVV